MVKHTCFENAFTLIELLIVVAIIAILAAIAVPNFLEAQTRAKVSRVMNDLRTVALGLEAYCVDTNTYPYNDGYWNVLPNEITTPIGYVQNTYTIIDPFKQTMQNPDLRDPLLARFYTYTKIVDLAEGVRSTLAGRPVPPEGIDAPGWNPGAFGKYGRWRLSSNGPDRQYSIPDHPDPMAAIDLPYDPTNGTLSRGNILRTQKEPRPGLVRP